MALPPVRLRSVALLLLALALALAGVLTSTERDRAEAADGTGTITGTVTRAGGGALKGVRVAAYREEDEVGLPWGPVTTDAAGHYELTDLPSGTYTVAFAPPAELEEELREEYWDAAFSASGATPVIVAAGATVTGIDAALDGWSAIEGTVTDTSGAPLASIRVTLYRHWPGYGDTTNVVFTRADGTYAFDKLDPASYRLGFDDVDDREYLPEYWEDAATLEEATRILIGRPAATRVADAQLTLGGRISGTVTGPDGEPLEDASVQLYRYDETEEEWIGAGAGSTNAAGDWSIPGLRAGQYRVSFWAWGMVREYFDDELSATASDALTVALGDHTTGIDARLAPGATINGVVTRPGGEPLGEIHATAYRWDAVAEAWTDYARTATADDGHYQLGDLPAGTYRVGFEDVWGDTYLDEYWDDAVDLADADNVVLTTGATRDGVDAELAERGGITGTVTGSEDQPELVDVTAYQWDGATGSWERAAYTEIDDRGRYELTGLQPGTYRVEFDDLFDPGYATEYWNDRPDLDSAQDITVGRGQIVSGIDAHLEPEGGAKDPAPSPPAPSPAAPAPVAPASPPATGTPTAGPVPAGVIKVLTRPRLTGKVKAGATLVVRAGRWQPATATVTVRWYAGGKAIAKATGTRLRLSGKVLKAVIGKKITARLTLSASGYTGTTLSLAAKGTIKRRR